MIFIMIINLIIITNLMILINIHPLTITILIVIQTLLLNCIMTSMAYSFWFTYMMILILLGGMLVLFIYITTLASNEMIKFSTKNFLMIMVTVMITMMFMTNKHFNMMWHLSKSDSFPSMYTQFSMEASKNLMQIYNYPNEMMTILTIMYLLITLIIVAYITQDYKGPLRQLN